VVCQNKGGRGTRISNEELVVGAEHFNLFVTVGEGMVNISILKLIELKLHSIAN